MQSKRWTRCSWLELFPEYVVIRQVARKKVDAYSVIAFFPCFKILFGIIDAWKAVSLSKAMLGLSEVGKKEKKEKDIPVIETDIDWDIASVLIYLQL